jgi:FtsX-like permease family
VIPSIRYRSLGEAPHRLILLPWSQWYRPDMSLYVEGDVSPTSLTGVLAQIEPDLPASIRSMSEKTSFTLIPLRLAGGVLAGAGAIGVFLAATGVFGVVAFSVSRRRRELAIRMALGARRGRIRAMVVGGPRTFRRDARAHWILRSCPATSEPGSVATAVSVYQRIAALPQVKPLPNAVRISRSPRCRRPDCTHSSIAIGMVAAVVFP